MNAVVTGGSRGIGFAAAKELAKDGYNLIITFNSNVQRADQAKNELQEKYKIKVFLVKGDLSEEATVDEIFECIKKNFENKLQAFVHNAGAAVGITSEAETKLAKKAADNYKQDIGHGTFRDFATYDYFQNIYPKCFIRCVENCVKIMEDNKGYIIAVSTYGSNHLQTPKPKYAITAQAKGCMELLVRYYAQVLGPRGITVNAVIPGYIMSDAWIRMAEPFGGVDSEPIRKKIEATPFKRFGEGKEFGDLISFLCSPRASFITGVSLPIDGGLHLQG